MKVKTLQRSLILLVALVFSVSAMAQTTLKGRIVDAQTKEALAGAVITNVKTKGVAVAKHDGTFQMPGATGQQELKISFLGYKEQTAPVNAAGKTFDVGDIEVEPDAFGLDNVVITASIVVKDRTTPVAVSNIPLEQIEMKLSNQEFPEILKSTPSVYATKQGGGYGDSRISMRGFDNSNIGVLINGVPVNDMENGRVYWSNWAGLSEVTSFMQVQRGLGASKLGLSSVGGTINIITKSTDATAGGSVYYGVGNDGLQKFSVNVSTGLMENGWAVTLAGGRTVANGYILGTNYEAWNYFANVSKVFGDSGHRLSFNAFGAPQWHNQHGTKHFIQDYRDSQDGRRLNRSYGYVNGDIVGTGGGYNKYHKPQISLVHSWAINQKSSLNTSVYASLSSGGGRVVQGSNKNWLMMDANTGRPAAGAAITPEGQFDYNYVYEQNRASTTGALAYFTTSANSHDWYGMLSTYSNQLTDRIKLTAGFDGRYYRGYHRENIDDLLGADYAYDNSIVYRDPLQQLKKGDIVTYDEMAEVFWAGVFAQAEYEKNNFSAFVSGSLSRNSYRWYNRGETPPAGYGTVSDWVGFLPYSVKAGANYKFARNHNVFVNGGYFTRAPFRNNAFIGYSTQPNPDAKMESVYTAEVGYGFANNWINLSFNGYYTMWLDKGIPPRRVNNEIYNIGGLNARHMGLELEATIRPTSNFNIKLMGSFGDWIWTDDVDFVVYDESQKPIVSEKAFVAGVHVGNSAQATAAVGANWTPFKDFKISADFNWFGKNFADFDPRTRTTLNDKVDAWQMPDYYTFDLALNYKFNLGKTKASIYGNVNNLFDAEYIADAKDGTAHNAATALVYYGFGRTWTAGLKINF